MSTVPTLRVASKDHAPHLPNLPDEVRLALTEVAASAWEGLLAMSPVSGLTVMSAMMQAKITDLAGTRGKHDPDRRPPRQRALLRGAGREAVPVSRPPARTVDGQEAARHDPRLLRPSAPRHTPPGTDLGGVRASKALLEQDIHAYPDSLRPKATHIR